jgi:transglutaminase-like putative cysteine protease
MKSSHYIISLLVCLIISFKIFSQKKPSVAKEAEWITVTQYDYNKTKLDNQAEDGYVDLIYEEQVSVEQQSVYCRRATKILTEAGIQNSSQISVDFDPSYQRIIFHTIRIIRGNTVLNQLNLSKIKTIQQEKELDKFMYDGSLSSVLFLEDVRKGDIIDYSFTITGFNPIFKGKSACNFEVNFAVPIYNIYYKLLVPAGRTVNIKNNRTDIQSLIKTGKGQTEYEWKLTDVNAFHVQDNVPSWYDPYSSIMASEYQSWKEVNDWAMELFAIPQKISSSLQKKINEIKLRHTSAEEQTKEILRFVQDDIRYMGIEMGANSHKPNQPNKVFAQRFGDCKDKSYLLCTMLHYLGIECEPVLVSTDSKKALMNDLPSPKVFNHVTVRVKLKDGYHWFDPTISYQRGGINDISYPDYQCGLVIGKNTDALTTINLKEPGVVKIKEIFYVEKMFDSVKFLVTTTYSGSFADNTRSDFNSTSRYELLKNFRSYYVDYYKDIIADSLNYEDNENTGVFTTKEYYTIPNIWESKDGAKKVSFSPYVIDGIIKKPKETNRTMPYSLTFPAHYKEDVEIDLPEDWKGEESVTNLKNDGFALSANFSYNNKKFLLAYEYESLKDNVSGDETTNFLNDINQKEASFNYELTKNDKPIIKNSETNHPGRNGYIIIQVVVLFLVVGTIWWKQRG